MPTITSHKVTLYIELMPGMMTTYDLSDDGKSINCVATNVRISTQTLRWFDVTRNCEAAIPLSAVGYMECFDA